MNKHLLHDLTEMGLWSPVVKNNIIHEDGSVQNIPEIPHELKAIYRYELPSPWPSSQPVGLRLLFLYYLFNVKLRFIFLFNLL